MKRKKFSQAEIFSILKAYESGTSVIELSRKHGFYKGTLYEWRRKYHGMSQSDMSRLKLLEEENSKLKRMFADLSLENVALKDLIEKKP